MEGLSWRALLPPFATASEGYIATCQTTVIILLRFKRGNSSDGIRGGLGGCNPHLPSQDIQRDGCVIIKTQILANSVIFVYFNA